MQSGYESRIDKAIREAQERGDFDNLPGVGKPLPGKGEQLADDWWARDWLRREGGVGALGLPPALRLRKEIEDLQATLAKEYSEQKVREILADLNERILAGRRGPVEGPPVTVDVVDVEDHVRRWREGRA